jgi:ankyrin repeat protein
VLFILFSVMYAQDCYTPINLAAAVGHTETVELLLVRGARIHAFDKVSNAM